jgi:uncharacterized protein YktB (UPF0637 family)
MATLGFLRRDFEVFAIEGFSVRLAKLDELINPRLTKLASEMTPELSRTLRMEFFPHLAKHMRRKQNPPAETWAAFGPSRAGYKRYPYLALCISAVGIHARAVVKADADNRVEVARAIKSMSAELEKSFRGTKIQQYQNWDCHELPRSTTAGAGFFDGLSDVLAKKSGALDVGFGWPVRDALTVDRAELLDAFRELAPLYCVLRSIAP